MRHPVLVSHCSTDVGRWPVLASSAKDAGKNRSLPAHRAGDVECRRGLAMAAVVSADDPPRILWIPMNPRNLEVSTLMNRIRSGGQHPAGHELGIHDLRTPAVLASCPTGIRRRVTESTITVGSIVTENGVPGDAFAPAACGLGACLSLGNQASPRTRASFVSA